MSEPTPNETDQLEGEVPRLLSPQELVALSKPSTVRGLSALAFDWLVIAAAIATCLAWFNPLTYVLAVVVIGGRQHGLGILMHEAAHYRLVKPRLLNDWLSEPLASWPIFITTRAYRFNHFAHHRHVNTPNDPDLQRKQSKAWLFPMSARALGTMLVRDVLGLNTHEQLAMFKTLAQAKKVGAAAPPKAPRCYVLARLAHLAAMIAVLSVTGTWFWFLLFWVVPLFTWAKLVMRLRSIAEHFATPSDHVYNRSRTTLEGWFDRWFVAPHHIGYHLEHHLYPSVPFHRLPALHRRLMEHESYRASAHLTRGYWGVLRECVRFRQVGTPLVSPTDV